MDELLSRKFHLNQVLNPQFTDSPKVDIKNLSFLQLDSLIDIGYHKTSKSREKIEKLNSRFTLIGKEYVAR